MSYILKAIPGKIGTLLRRLYFSKKYFKHRNFTISRNVTLFGGENISVGKGFEMV